MELTEISNSLDMNQVRIAILTCMNEAQQMIFINR